MEKRAAKSKNTTRNSANFLSMKTSYNPDWFVVSNKENLQIISQIAVVPTWGIRRAPTKHFNYEFGFGLGYRYQFYKQAGYSQDESGVAVNIHFRVGYTF